MAERYSFAYPSLPWGSSPPVFIEWVRASDYDALAALLAAARRVMCACCAGLGVIPVVDVASQRSRPCPDCADLRSILRENERE